jgi:hypothetical protein
VTSSGDDALLAIVDDDISPAFKGGTIADGSVLRTDIGGSALVVGRGLVASGGDSLASGVIYKKSGGGSSNVQDVDRGNLCDASGNNATPGDSVDTGGLYGGGPSSGYGVRLGRGGDHVGCQDCGLMCADPSILSSSNVIGMRDVPSHTWPMVRALSIAAP